MLENKINDDFKEAMKAKDEVKVSTLRMLKSAIKNFSIEKKKEKDEKLSDDEIIGIVSKEIKKRNEAIEGFKKGGRDELVKQEEAELKVLSAYMPEQLSEEKIKEIVVNVVAELGVTSKRDMGKVMKEVMVKTKGRANGKMVSGLVSKALEEAEKGK